ncbi:hypothetical protein L6586_002897 [Listeria monocytogenes]|nr:hypothetical protein [Listeria monocytogenes]
MANVVMKRPIRKGTHVVGNVYLSDIALFLAIPGFFFLLGYYFVAGPLKIFYDIYFLPFGAYMAINSQVNLGKKNYQSIYLIFTAERGVWKAIDRHEVEQEELIHKDQASYVKMNHY